MEGRQPEKLRRALIEKYRVLEAGDAEKALEWLRKEPSRHSSPIRNAGMFRAWHLLEKALAIQHCLHAHDPDRLHRRSDLIESINTGRVYNTSQTLEPGKTAAGLREAVHHFELVQVKQRLQKQLQQANEHGCGPENRISGRSGTRGSPGGIVFPERVLGTDTEAAGKGQSDRFTVLIQGETAPARNAGRHIHRNSLRATRYSWRLIAGPSPGNSLKANFSAFARRLHQRHQRQTRYFEMATTHIFCDEIVNPTGTAGEVAARPAEER